MINIQQAPSPVQSSLEFPTKFASRKNQLIKGEIDFKIINNVRRVKTALKLFELIFLLRISNLLIPLNSTLIKYKPIKPNMSGKK